jgi:hypothetical protein
VTDLTVTDRLGGIVAHVSTREPFGADSLHVVGVFVPGPAFAQLEAPLAEFRNLFAQNFEKAALFHERLDRLGLRASDEIGHRYDVCNIHFQNNGLLFSANLIATALPLTSGVEIFARSLDTPPILAWLDASLGPFSSAESTGDAQVFDTRVGPLVVTPAVDENQLTSFWLNSAAAPWASDIDFARAVTYATAVTVRCDSGQGDLSDHLLEVSPNDKAL